MTQAPPPPDSEFAQQMQGVTPLQLKVTTPLQKNAIDTASQAHRRLAAQRNAPLLEPLLGRSNVEQIGPQDAFGFRSAGIQEGVFRKLRLGRFEIEARLDLHRHTLEQAQRELLFFIQACLDHGLRTVLILPGKGERDQTTPAVLKSHLRHWLEELNEVLAFHTAQPQHGGTGAVYVLLRKKLVQK